MHHLFGFCNGIENSSAQHSANFVEAVFQRGHNPKIATTAAHAPEEIGIVRSIGGKQPAIGGDHIRADDIVYGEPMLAMQVAPAAAKRQPCDAGR